MTINDGYQKPNCITTQINEAESLTRQLKVLLNEAYVFLCILRKFLKGSSS